MLTNLPQDFLEAISSSTRSPVQLMAIELPYGQRFLSDTVIGKADGLEEDYSPWVESWGTMYDNSNISALFEGRALELKTSSLVLLISTDTTEFIKELFFHGIENTRVRLYQWFRGMTSPPVLIDTMLCQSPIEYKEGNMQLSIGLVSELAVSNEYLQNQRSETLLPDIAIGSISGVPLIYTANEPIAILKEAIDASYTGPVLISGDKLNESGIMVIDTEEIAYSNLVTTTATILSRGANGTTPASHESEALAFHKDAFFDYAVNAAASSSLSLVESNGVPYENDVSWILTGNPSLARFFGRPPWLQVSGAAQTEASQLEAVTEDLFSLYSYKIDSGTLLPEEKGYTTPDNINNITSSAYINLKAISTTTDPGFFTKDSLDSSESNLSQDIYDNTKFYGSSNLAYSYMIINDSESFSTAVGTYGSIDHIYDQDDSASGTLTRTEVTVHFKACFCRNKKVQVDIAVLVDGNYTHLDLSLMDGLTNNGNIVYSQFNQRSKTYDLGSLIPSFESLKTAKIRISLDYFGSNEDSPINERDCTVSFRAASWNVFYDTVPQEHQEGTLGLGSIFLETRGDDTVPYPPGVDLLIPPLSVEALIQFSLTTYNETHPGFEEVFIEVVGVDTTPDSDETVYWSDYALGEYPTTEIGVNLDGISWEELKTQLVYARITILTDGFTTFKYSADLKIDHLIWRINYERSDVAAPTSPRVVYADKLSCTVTSLHGENPTPPAVIRKMIQDSSPIGHMIDEVSFHNADTVCRNNSYYLNGALPSDITLHAALRVVLKEGLCRLLFTQGQIRIITHFDYDLQQDSFIIDNDDTQIKSKVIENLSFSDIKNSISVVYDKDRQLGIFRKQLSGEDSASISRFSKLERQEELQLISNEESAAIYLNSMLTNLARPTEMYTFNMFMRGYALEKGDKVSLQVFLDDRFTVTGAVLTTEREFGKGSAGKINLFKIKLNDTVVNASLDLFDTIEINDTVVSILKGVILSDTILLSDKEISARIIYSLPLQRLRISEHFYTELCQVNGYGTCGYGVHPYGK